MNKRKTRHASTGLAIGGRLDEKNIIETFLTKQGYTLVKTSRPEMTIIKKVIGMSSTPKVSSDQMAKTLVLKIGQALVSPGLSRTSVFKSRSAHSEKAIFAYSIDPDDTSRFIREDESGVRTIGRMVNGKFSLIHAAA